jgi:outer membrane receptor protein involved in Fe transport
LQTTRNAAFKAALLAGGAGVMALAQPAMAQDNNAQADEPVSSTPSSDQASSDTAQQGIVVTGSRIRKQDYESNSPLVTADAGLLTNSSTSALEQNLNKLPQFVPSKTPTGINAGDIQPTATNTPGSANISLRGLGANRNLVLIDGRRATPGNATGTVDINTIPTAAVERVEIITGGASATYGADAIGGVANFILKKNFQGLELDGRTGLSEHGDGFEYDIGGIMGADFDDGRGNVSIAMSTNRRQKIYQRDRKWYRDNWSNPNLGGAGFFPPAAGVAVTGVNGTVFNNVFGTLTPDPTLAGYSIYANQNGTPWFGTAYAQRAGAGLNTGVDGFNYKQTAIGTIAANDTFLFAQLPLTRYNFLARGNYEINDWIGVFGQGMYTHTHTHTVQEGGPIVGGWNVNLPYGDAIYAGNTSIGVPSSLNADGSTNAAYLPGGRFGLTNCPTTGGCPTYLVFPLPAQFQQLMLGRGTTQVGTDNNGNPIYDGSNAPIALNYLFPFPRANSTDVDSYNLTGGLQGSVPGTDWTWEAFVNHGASSTYAIQTGVISLNRLRALLASPNWGKGFSANSNATGFGFGSNSATCTSGFNIFDPGTVSSDCLDAIRADLKNRSYIRQTIWEADATGTLFQLPAGPLQAAIGASYRDTAYKFTNDTLTDQGVSFQDQALGIYPSGDTAGSINVKEVYGELLVPVLKDSFIKEFSLELGGRISDYNTTGTSYTYKALANLAVTDWLRFRGGYNRAERAPNIAELFLAPQQTFAFNGLGDICSQRSTYPVSAASSPDVKAVCSAVMDKTAGAGSGAAYYNVAVANQPPPGGGFAFPTLIGNPNLKPEQADTWTFGGVIRSPFSSPFLSRLQLSVDWFQIKIKHAIGNSPGATLQTCFDPALNPLVNGASGSAAQAEAAANSFNCAGVAYQAGPFPGSPPGLGNITETFTNTGKINIEGIDAQLDWSAPIGPGTVNLNVVASYFMHYKVADLASNPMVDYTGTFGTTVAGLSGAAFEWRTLTTLGYTLGKGSISLQWQHTPSVEDSAEPLAPNPITGGPSYNLFNLNTSYTLTDNVTVHFGIDNLFNKRPPLTGVNTAADISLGQLPGGSFNSLYYDDLGRRFSAGVNMKF